MKSIKNSELRYRRLFEAAQDGILILDAKTGAITDVNPFLINMLGYTQEEFLNKKLWEIGAFSDVESSLKAFEILKENEYIRYENLPLKTKSGKLIQVEFISNVYQVGAEKVIQCNIRDISDRILVQKALLESEALLREQSVRDHLTGLFNRRYMEETLEREILRAVRKNFSLGIIMLDIDDFKRFNDTFGHAAGDVILQELGHLLIEHFRGDDIPSRYGGDEFVIAMPDSPLDITLARAERLCEHTRHFHIEFEGKILEAMKLSIGVAIFPQDGPTSVSILKAADSALYRAKHAKGNQVVIANQCFEKTH